MTGPAAPTTGPTPNAMPGAAAAAQAAPPAAPAPGPAAPAVPPALAGPAAGAPSAPPAPGPTTPPDPAAPTPPWGSDAEFDPNKAWNLIQNVRGENATLRGKLADAQPILDAADQHRRDEQGALATAQEDLDRERAETARWRNQAVGASATQLATDKGFSVPAAALAMVGDLADYITADGLDKDKFGSRLDQLATEYPALVTAPAPAGEPQAPAPPQRPFGVQPDLGQGQAGTAPNTIAEQIKAAQARGDFTTVIALRQQQAYANQQPQPQR